MKPAKILLPPFIVFVLVVLLAEWIIVHEHVAPYLVPKPSAVGRYLWQDRNELLLSALKTGQAAGGGFLLSLIIGILLAILLSAPLMRRAFYPYTVFFQTVPVVAIAPLLVVWVGPGIKSVTFCAFIVSVFPVIANTLAGIASTDPALRDLLHLYGAGPIKEMIKLRLPAALPQIFTGLRIAAGLAIIGAIVGEFTAGTIEENPGLGILIVEAAKFGQTARVFAAIVMSSLLGLLLTSIVQFVGWFTLRNWHASSKEI